MIEERAMELVAALRSDNYVQGRAQLHNRQNQFCCLGVACDISGIGQWSEDDGKQTYDTGDFTSSAYILPPVVKDYFDFASHSGEWTTDVVDEDLNDCWASLVGLNDAGWSFAKIADFIEKNWEHL